MQRKQCMQNNDIPGASCYVLIKSPRQPARLGVGGRKYIMLIKIVRKIMPKMVFSLVFLMQYPLGAFVGVRKAPTLMAVINVV